MALARYTFLPWLRRGTANAISVPATAASRAAIAVGLSVNDGTATGAPITKAFLLAGPGDVMGFNRDQIVRTEPRSWVTDFEPNYLAFVEFYDEDFCWRHTPAPPDPASHRLVPWLTLVVLADGEFALNQLPGRPLPSVVITGDAKLYFPPPDQAWAWAHVQVTGNFGNGPAPDPAQLASALAGAPDSGVCRLLCSRRLVPDSGYTAFVVPTFEVGRKAGLQIAFDDATESGTAIAWAQGAQEYPFYHQWYFRTGHSGDFEDLVERIQARAVDQRVGVREMDIAAPGFGMADLVAPADASPDPRIVGLEGALRAPTMRPIPLAPTSTFPEQAAVVVNRPADVQEIAPDSDPVIAPPLTGGWHALVNRVDPAAMSNWVNALNLDPRERAASGLGSRAIEVGQEHYMALAWEQVGEVLAANRRVNGFRFSAATADKLFTRHIEPASTPTVLALTAPVFSRVMGSPLTMRGLLASSRMPNAALSPAFRKLMRPRGLVARRAIPEPMRRGLVGAVALAANDQRISAAGTPPPVAGPTIEAVAAEVPLPDGDAGAATLRYVVIIALALLLGIFALAMLGGFAGLLILIGAVTIAGAIVAVARRRRAASIAANNLDLAAITPERLPAEPPPTFAPGPAGADMPPPDSAAAAQFAEAHREFVAKIAVHQPPALQRPALDLVNARSKVSKAIAPAIAYPRRADRAIRIGNQSLSDYARGAYSGALVAGEALAPIMPVMAYPDIRDAMYAPLAALSDELFVPNLGLVAPNTVSLMLTNSVFIEAYMAGANYEFARELLWREYPTDCRGSPFRQFWDIDATPTPGLVGAARAAALKDIRPLHEWGAPSALGTHPVNGRDLPADRIVLVLRGDLLKRYPNTIVYAQRAVWSSDARHRNELALYDEEGAKALAGIDDPNLRYPAFRATVAPDLHFIGFDLSLEEARGDPALDETAQARTTLPADRLGWFFALQEILAEPRLGLDEEVPAAEMRSDYKWDNFSWENVDLGSGLMIDLARPLVSEPEGTMPADKTLSWLIAGGATAADIAGILNQKPVLVAWHARQMLEAGKIDEV
jgi:hypothetical protein